MSDAETEEGRNGIQVIARAASILRALKNEREGLSLGQIADRVKLPRSTVQRIVGALQTERFVISAGPERGIRLGPELQSLADGAKINIAEVVRPYLIDLSRKTEETVDLAVLRNDKLIFLDQIAGTQRLRAVSNVGDIFPLTTTANGKACLALMPDEDILRISQAEWGRDAAEAKTMALLTEVKKIRKTGVAFDEDEHTMGISAAGIAFKDWQGSLYAVSIPTPTARLVKNRKIFADCLKHLTVRIDKLLQTLVRG